MKDDVLEYIKNNKSDRELRPFSKKTSVHEKNEKILADSIKHTVQQSSKNISLVVVGSDHDHHTISNQKDIELKNV